MIFNSVDAMPQGGKIHIATYTKNESIYLELSDNGIGMTEEIKNRIYDPFFTTKGTMFTIVLPKGKENIEKRNETRDSVAEIRKANILIIDDQPEVSVVLSEMLSTLGHQTCTCSTSTGGIEAFKKGDYEIRNASCFRMGDKLMLPGR